MSFFIDLRFKGKSKSGKTPRIYHAKPTEEMPARVTIDMSKVGKTGITGERVSSLLDAKGKIPIASLTQDASLLVGIKFRKDDPISPNDRAGYFFARVGEREEVLQPLNMPNVIAKAEHADFLPIKRAYDEFFEKFINEKIKKENFLDRNYQKMMLAAENLRVGGDKTVDESAVRNGQYYSLLAKLFFKDKAVIAYFLYTNGRICAPDAFSSFVREATKNIFSPEADFSSVDYQQEGYDAYTQVFTRYFAEDRPPAGAASAFRILVPVFYPRKDEESIVMRNKMMFNLLDQLKFNPRECGEFMHRLYGDLFPNNVVHRGIMDGMLDMFHGGEKERKKLFESLRWQPREESSEATPPNNVVPLKAVSLDSQSPPASGTGPGNKDLPGG